MPRKAIQIEISARLKGLLEKELNRSQLEGHYAKRIKIICLSSTGMANQDVAKAVGCLDKTVRKWRSRLKSNEDILKVFEKGHDGIPIKDKDLVGKLKEIISDIPRPGAPARITVPEVSRLQALACEHPEKYGLPFTVWTHEELSKQAKKMGIEVSPAHYGRLLKKRIKSP